MRGFRTKLAPEGGVNEISDSVPDDVVARIKARLGAAPLGSVCFVKHVAGQALHNRCEVVDLSQHAVDGLPSMQLRHCERLGMGSGILGFRAQARSGRSHAPLPSVLASRAFTWPPLYPSVVDEARLDVILR